MEIFDFKCTNDNDKLKGSLLINSDDEEFVETSIINLIDKLVDNKITRCCLINALAKVLKYDEITRRCLINALDKVLKDN